jgi:hypothetical protein
MVLAFRQFLIPISSYSCVSCLRKRFDICTVYENIRDMKRAMTIDLLLRGILVCMNETHSLS